MGYEEASFCTLLVFVKVLNKFSVCFARYFWAT